MEYEAQLGARQWRLDHLGVSQHVRKIEALDVDRDCESSHVVEAPCETGRECRRSRAW
jgi:hypothetical protein